MHGSGAQEYVALPLTLCNNGGELQLSTVRQVVDKKMKALLCAGRYAVKLKFAEIHLLRMTLHRRNLDILGLQLFGHRTLRVTLEDRFFHVSVIAHYILVGSLWELYRLGYPLI
jgi:DUF971 family protein